jgi:DNA-binding NarL/FixJ family response regulator
MNTVNTVRILLADDHTLLRAGIRSLLEKMPGVEVIGKTMDIAMAGLNGLEATARIAREFPNVRVIILSMHANEEYVLQTLRAGAAGYLLKDAATAELELAINAVARNDTYLSPAISKRVIEDYLGRTSGQKSPLEQLTPRQREILQLIAEGKSTKEMAFLLNVSVKTVETHRAQLMDRLGVHDVPGLVRHAMRMGLVPPEQ